MIQIIWKKTQIDALVHYLKGNEFKREYNDKEYGELVCLLVRTVENYVNILQEEYNTNEYQTLEELEKSSGGYIVFHNGEDEENTYMSIIEKYHINEEEAEFTDIILSYIKDEIEITWIAELFCFTNFNIIVIRKK